MQALLLRLLHGSTAAVSQYSRPPCAGRPQTGQDLITSWGRSVLPDSIPLPAYPRPQLVRPASSWTNMNGVWEWSPCPAGASPTFGMPLRRSILVPFPAESCLSGVMEHHPTMMYRRTFATPQRRRNTGANGKSVTTTLLHFGAVDWQSTVWLNGQRLGNHTGGYDGFSFDISALLNDDKTKLQLNELFVYVYDPSENGTQPMGKQRVDAIAHPGGRNGDHYTPTSGIWQTVWLERVPHVYIDAFAVRADLTKVYVRVGSTRATDAEKVSIRVLDAAGAVVATLKDVALPPPGTELSIRVPKPLLWSPTSPHLYGLNISLSSGDAITSYVGMRVFSLGSSTRGNGGGAGSATTATFAMLNGKPIFCAGWLDQSWWPDGLYTAPTDAALAFDISAAKTFGFNTVRLHQKINPERWYYHADRIGVLVFQDAVQTDAMTQEPSVALFKEDWRRAIVGRRSHPSIVQWEIFNEGDCWDRAPFNVTEMVEFTRALDPHRLVDTHSGVPNLNAGGDVNDIHSYSPIGPPEPNATHHQYSMIGEFGGVGAFVKGKAWVPGQCNTYLHVPTPADEATVYIQMAQKIERMTTVSAAIYTQIADVELECDGFLNYDRTNKFDASSIAAIKAANEALIRSAAVRG